MIRSTPTALMPWRLNRSYAVSRMRSRAESIASSIAVAYLRAVFLRPHAVDLHLAAHALDAAAAHRTTSRSRRRAASCISLDVTTVPRRAKDVRREARFTGRP